MESMVTERFGDLVAEAKQFDVLIHGCNCQNTMGSGIAKAFRERWPGVYEADTKAHKAGLAKLGNVSIYYDGEDDVTIVNCYTQFDFTGRHHGQRDVNYEAIARCFEKVAQMFDGKKIGIPLIGCGLAGGDWRIVRSIADVCFAGQNVTVVKLKE